MGKNKIWNIILGARMKKLILLTFMALTLTALWFGQHNGGQQRDAVASAATVAPSPQPPKREPVPEEQVQRLPAGKEEDQAALRKSEMDSLENLSRTLSQVGQAPLPLKNLVEGLQKSGQEPLVVRDANPDTGEMIIVRTKSPLPGTRYFHAQYFTGEGGERFVQHMSFEFKPGPQSMSEAIASVEKTFPNLSRPKVKREDYVQWSLDRDYIVWVKKMSLADLRDDPFNAYSAADNGTIRVAVELEIHGE